MIIEISRNTIAAMMLTETQWWPVKSVKNCFNSDERSWAAMMQPVIIVVAAADSRKVDGSFFISGLQPYVTGVRYNGPHQKH